MPRAQTILQRRQARRQRVRTARRVPLLLLGLAAALAVLAGILASGAAFALGALTDGLPSVMTIERRFSTGGLRAFATTRLFDRESNLLLAEATHPGAAERRWLTVERSTLERPQVDFLRALIAYQGPGFASDPGYNAAALLGALLGASPRPTITEQLARDTLLPLADLDRSDLALRLRAALQAAELTRRYPKERILEWYLNSADFGHLAYGMDAAALVYFGKHANDLSLAESAMLAGIPARPQVNPFDFPLEARTRQLEVLLTMESRGWISRAQLEAAQAEPLALASAGAVEFPEESSAARYVWGQLQRRWGTEVTSRSGLNIVTTLDADLQAQAACTVETHLARLSGGDPSAVAPAAGGACVAAGLLPPLRPSEAEDGQRPESASVVVLDAQSGQLLALDGDASTARPAGTSFSPLVYLTAFSRGYAPASMIIDAAASSAAGPPTGEAEQGESSHGLMRMRTALANGFRSAAARTWLLAGAGNIVRTARQMGVRLGQVDEPSLSPDDVQASLLDLTQAYALFANLGRAEGLAAGETQPDKQNANLEAAAILRLEDPATGESYTPAGQARTVLSPQLAYLMAHVLSDEPARWPNYHQGNVLEVGRPAGALAGSSKQGSDSWSIGFTPERVVGVWLGNPDGAPLHGIDDLTGAAPIWHALLRYATRDLVSAGWPIPPGIETVDVCDPSGLLPTEYCPQVVREVFLPGTRPTQYDNIFRPFRINRETGKLATLLTPLELVEERVFLIPPPEAAQWAEQMGIPQPPQEYDTVAGAESASGEVAIRDPLPFAYVRGKLALHGSAAPPDLEFYRLQAGQGMNPDRWIQIGSDSEVVVEDGLLGTWDTGDLNGLYTLQLVAVRKDGQLETAAIQVSLDNSPPEIRVVNPAVGTPPVRAGQQVVLQVEVGDNLGVSEVEFYLDGTLIETFRQAPFSLRWAPDSAGTYAFSAHTKDLAGNQAETDPIEIVVSP
jgi:membrane peptidoglycan carboxypeptidase